MPKLGEVTVPLKKVLICRGCGASWKPDPSIPRRLTACPHCGKPKDPRDRRKYSKQYYRAPERLAKLKEWAKKHRKQKGEKDRSLLKKRLFFAISGTINAVCARCGCDDWRLLEVNHKKGGGKKEFETGRYATALYHDVVQGRRKADDLEILCRPCNAIHYLEMKFGPLPMRVLWGAEGK